MIARDVQPGSQHGAQRTQAPVRRPADRSGASLLTASRHTPADLGPAHLLALQRSIGNQAVQRLIAHRQGAPEMVQRMTAETSADLAEAIHGGNTQSTTAVAQDDDGDVIVYTQSTFVPTARRIIKRYLRADGNRNASIYKVKLRAGTRTGKHAEMAIYHAHGDDADSYGASQDVCRRCARVLNTAGKSYAPYGGQLTDYWWDPRAGVTYSPGAKDPTRDASRVRSSLEEW